MSQDQKNQDQEEQNQNFAIDIADENDEAKQEKYDRAHYGDPYKIEDRG